MAENKTKPTDASVESYITSKAREQQHADCKELMALLKRVTRQHPKMWGSSIVGYGSYQYTYESGRSGEAPLVGFAIRGKEMVVYLLADLETSVLERLVAGSVAEVKRRYGRGSRASAAG